MNVLKNVSWLPRWPGVAGILTAMLALVWASAGHAQAGGYTIANAWAVTITDTGGGTYSVDIDRNFSGTWTSVATGVYIDDAAGFFGPAGASGPLPFTANGAALEVHFGTAAANTIAVSADTYAFVFGFAGADGITGSNKPMIAFGGADGDTITGGSSTDEIYGHNIAGDPSGAGGDTLSGMGGADWIEGSGGADTISGGDGDDFLNGDDGADTITGDADDDDILGGADGDTISGGTGDDIIDGQGGNDILNGNADDDTISGGDGMDDIFGEDAAGTGTGDDTLHGGAGDDFMFGGAGTDTLNGNGGDDALDGGAGIDTLNGGDGMDYLEDMDSSAGDTMNGNGGDDLLHSNDAAIDTLDGGTGTNVLYCNATDTTSNGTVNAGLSPTNYGLLGTGFTAFATNYFWKPGGIWADVRSA